MPTWRGGVRLGLLNATWPFATLTASPDALVLKVHTLGTYRLSSDQIVDVEPYFLLPFIGEGVRIRHTVEHYPEKMIFWYFGDRKALAREVKGCIFGDKKAVPPEEADLASP